MFSLFYRRNPNGCPISAKFYISTSRRLWQRPENVQRLPQDCLSLSLAQLWGAILQDKNSWGKWQVKGGRNWDFMMTTGPCREILAAYRRVHLEDIRGMRAPFLAIGVTALDCNLLLIIIKTTPITSLNCFRATLCSLCFMKQILLMIHQCQSMKTR